VSDRRGREGLVVLTQREVDRLAELALEVHGKAWGPEFTALFLWGAYTCMRPGEIFAARFALLDGDVYHLQKQFSSRLGKETAPKHGGVGEVYVPEAARRAVLAKPRRLGDELIFRTRRGHQFRQGSLHHAWALVRAAFTAELPAGHHLRRRLAFDSEDHLDFYELRHFGASYMLNELELEPWVIAKQLRHSDGGALVVRLYGHPAREKAIERMRRAFGGVAPEIRPGTGESRGIATVGDPA
jgi:integrase